MQDQREEMAHRSEEDMMQFSPAGVGRVKKEIRSVLKMMEISAEPGGDREKKGTGNSRESKKRIGNNDLKQH